MTALLTTLLLALTLPTAPTAQAADKADGGYRYWSFWLQKDTGSGEDTGDTKDGEDGDGDTDTDAGSWSYATEGPATQRPEDGDTLGFRFALSEDSRNAEKPRGDAEFATACADTPEKSGSKRVALRLDFGTRADAPKNEPGGAPPKARTECARVAENASAAVALAAVSKSLRYGSDSLLCAIDGYPAKGCGEQVADSGDTGRTGGSEATKDEGTGAGSDDDGDEGGALSTSLGLAAGIAAVAVLGTAALWQARRRKQ